MENQDPNMQSMAALPQADDGYYNQQHQFGYPEQWEETHDSTEKAKKVKKSKKEKKEKKKKDRSRSRSRSRKKKSKKSKKRSASSDIEEDDAAKRRASFMSKGGFSGGFTGDASPATTSSNIPGMGTLKNGIAAATLPPNVTLAPLAPNIIQIAQEQGITSGIPLPPASADIPATPAKKEKPENEPAERWVHVIGVVRPASKKTVVSSITQSLKMMPDWSEKFGVLDAMQCHPIKECVLSTDQTRCLIEFGADELGEASRTLIGVTCLGSPLHIEKATMAHIEEFLGKEIMNPPEISPEKDNNVQPEPAKPVMQNEMAEQPRKPSFGHANGNANAFLQQQQQQQQQQNQEPQHAKQSGFMNQQQPMGGGNNNMSNGGGMNHGHGGGGGKGGGRGGMGGGYRPNGTGNSMRDRKQRELYFGNMPAGQFNAENIKALCNPAMTTVPEYSGSGDPVLNVSMCSDGRYCFVEFQSAPMATRALEVFKDITLDNRRLAVNRPNGYVNGDGSMVTIQNNRNNMTNFNATPAGSPMNLGPQIPPPPGPPPGSFGMDPQQQQMQQQQQQPHDGNMFMDPSSSHAVPQMMQQQHQQPVHQHQQMMPEPNPMMEAGMEAGMAMMQQQQAQDQQQQHPMQGQMDPNAQQMQMSHMGQMDPNAQMQMDPSMMQGQMDPSMMGQMMDPMQMQNCMPNIPTPQGNMQRGCDGQQQQFCDQMGQQQFCDPNQQMMQMQAGFMNPGMMDQQQQPINNGHGTYQG